MRKTKHGTSKSLLDNGVIVIYDIIVLLHRSNRQHIQYAHLVCNRIARETLYTPVQRVYVYSCTRSESNRKRDKCLGIYATVDISWNRIHFLRS